MNAFEHYEELVYLTRLYLSKEIKEHWQIADDTNCFNYFKDYALSLRQMASKKEENTAKNQYNPLPVKSTPPKIEKQTEIKSSKTEVTQTKTESTQIQREKVIQKEVESVESKVKTDSFSLQLPDSSPKADFSSLQKNIHEHFPHFEILTTIPSDHEARVKANEWKSGQASIVIAATAKKPNEREFIDKVVKALQERNFTIKLVDATTFNQSLSRNLKLIIADRQILGSYQDLQKYYRWNSQQLRHYIGTVPLIILENLDRYMSDNKAKKELWNSLKQILNI